MSSACDTGVYDINVTLFTRVLRIAMEFPAKLDDLLCLAVYRANHAFNARYRPLLDEIGLTYPQYLVMISLWSRDDQTVGELCRAIALESNTMTPILKRLEVLGFISRRRDQIDERSVRVQLTPDGISLADRAKHIPKCVSGTVDFTSEEVDDLVAKMQIIEKAMRGEIKPSD